MSELASKYFERALTAIRQRDYVGARDILVEVIKLKPDLAEAWVLRGNVMHAMEHPFEAVLHYDRALELNDKLHDAWNNRGIACADLAMFRMAEECFRKSAAIMPAVEPRMGLANMYCTQNRLVEAAAEYRAAIACDPAFGEAHFNLGVTLLGLGRWEEGFREYEYRWANNPYPPRAYRNYPKWRGEDLAGKTIILYPEQGYGDEIMALRFAHVIRNRFSDALVVVLARTPMLRLAQTIEQPRLAVVPHDYDGEADFSCPLLDVPGVLGMGPFGTTPYPDRYLSLKYPDESLLFSARLADLPPGLNVGLCWNSGGHLNTARASQMAKSIPLPQLKPLAMRGVNLISLQHDRREPLPPDMDIHDWMAECHDFADTAALIDALDLVISVDTAVAHLAGALGKPVANFVRFSGYWPWLDAGVLGDAERSIWYPSMKLLRQRALSDWREPIARARTWLAAEAKRKAA